MKLFLDHIKSALRIILILCLVSIVIEFFIAGSISYDRSKMHFFYNFYYGLPLSIINGIYYDRLEQLLPWDKQPKSRAWIGFLGSIILTMITLIILNYILWVLIRGNNIDVLFAKGNRSMYLIALLITIIISLTLHALGFFKEINIEKRKSEKLRQEILRSELNALKAHVDPHFLFNSFNALSGLIDEDTDKAQDFYQD